MSALREMGILRRIKGFMMRRMHGMITCAEFEDFVLRYLDDELPAKQRKVFEWHMRLCRECREYLAAYERSMEVSGAVLGPPASPAPEDVPDDLVRAILDARRH